MTELKPCPFCGGKVTYAYNAELEPYGVQCIRCHAIVTFYRVKMKKTFGEAMEKLAEAWNRREEQ